MLDQTDDSSVKSAVRVLDVFEFLSKLDRPVTHGELADALAIPKSSLSKLIKTLESRRYLVQTQAPATGFRLGPKFKELVEPSDGPLDLAELGMPGLRKIVELTGESSALNRLRGDVAEVIATVGGQQRLSTTMRLGDVAPLYATSGGKAILAFMPDAWINEYFERIEFEKITSNTISDSRGMTKQIEVIRKKGFAYSFNEYTPGITGIGKAVLNPEGLPVASVNVTIPSARYTDTVRDEVEMAISAAVSALERAHKRGS